jgi:hypothetical protein
MAFASSKRQRSSQLALSNIASLPLNIPRLPTVILNDDGISDHKLAYDVQ